MLKSVYLFLILFNAVLQLFAATPAVATVAAVEDNLASAPAAVDVDAVATSRTTHNNDNNNNNNCHSNSLDQSLYCRGSRAIRNVINNLNKSDAPLIIVRGLEIVRSPLNASDTPADYSNAIDDDSFLGRFSEYLRTHELNIKFSELLAEESERVSARDLEKNGNEIGNKIDDFVGVGIEEARKKDKGQGVLMAMALMFGKMMAVMGLGGIGALAMKALGVAMAALMMAGMVGLKSLSQQGGGGHETKHSVQYLTADGHHLGRRRRRRSLDLIKQLYSNNKKRTNDPYRGWLRGGNQSAQ